MHHFLTHWVYFLAHPLGIYSLAARTQVKEFEELVSVYVCMRMCMFTYV